MIYPKSDGPKKTMDRLVTAVTNRDITVACIDHAEAARENRDDIAANGGDRFGNPRAGTPLMQARRTIIGLPLKALVWQDDEGKTWLAYNKPVWLAARHGAEAGANRVLGAMAEMLAAVAKEATDTRDGNSATS